jgi:hypothetical protein
MGTRPLTLPSGQLDAEGDVIQVADLRAGQQGVRGPKVRKGRKSEVQIEPQHELASSGYIHLPPGLDIDPYVLLF